LSWREVTAVLQFLIFKLKGQLLMMRTVDPVLDSVSLCKIPFDEKGVIVDRVHRQILVPVEIAITAEHVKRLKNYLSDEVASIETGSLD